jgi:hypothetical protein
MKKLSKALVTLVCVIGLVIMFGCAGLQDLVIPCHIDEGVIEYSQQPATSYLPWTTVFDAERIRAYTDYTHLDYQKSLKDLLEDDNLQYSFYTDRLISSIADARQLQQKLFDPNGSIGMAITALFGGTIGALFINTPKKNNKNGTS